MTNREYREAIAVIDTCIKQYFAHLLEQVAVCTETEEIIGTHSILRSPFSDIISIIQLERL